MCFCAYFLSSCVTLDKAVSETQPCSVKKEDNSLLLHREEMSFNQAEWVDISLKNSKEIAVTFFQGSKENILCRCFFFHESHNFWRPFHCCWKSTWFDLPGFVQLYMKKYLAPINLSQLPLMWELQPSTGLLPALWCSRSNAQLYWESGDFIIRQDNTRKLDIFRSEAFVLWSILIGVTW